MAGEYLVPADFRPETPTAATRTLTLTEDLAKDDELTEQIEAVSRRIDHLTGDRFSPETVSVDVDVFEYSRRLYLPGRWTAITSIETRDITGGLTVQTASVYRQRRSLNATGTATVFDRDYVEILAGGLGLSGPDIDYGYRWPLGAATVRISGTRGWTVTPGDIKRVVAMLVWDHFMRENGDVRRAQRWQRGDLLIERAEDSLTGLPEADKLLKRFVMADGDADDDDHLVLIY